MAIFKGEKSTKIDDDDSFLLIEEKLVPVSPTTIRFSSRDKQTEPFDYYNSMNEWHLEKNNKGILCYRVTFFRSKDTNYHVVVCLGLNDSVRRLFKDKAKAQESFDSIMPYTQLKTLRNRGYFRW